MSQDLKNVSII